MDINALIVICTRPDSKRIPNKCFKKIAGIKALSHIINRVKVCGIPIILAIPKGLRGYYMDYEKIKNLFIFEGNPTSPLHRMRDAIIHYSKEFNKDPEYIIRITHDDILIDAQTVLELLNVCANEKSGYGITPDIIDGAGVEVISTKNILHAAETNERDIEHISYFVKGKLPNDSITLLRPRSSVCRPYRLTMDYPEDAIILQTILRNFQDFPKLDDVCQWLDQNSHILNYNKLPEVTLYTCARNAENWIPNTLKTSMNLHTSMEYIVLDDYSTDGTLNEIMNFASLYKDSRLKVILNERNLGLSTSCNKVLNEARGNYIMRIDADDILMPNALQVMLNEIKATDAAIVYSAYKEIDENGKILRDNCPPQIHHHAGCALMNKKLINEIRFTYDLQHWDSLDLYNRIRKQFKIAYINQPLWLYRQHGDSMSKSNNPERSRIRKELEK